MHYLDKQEAKVKIMNKLVDAGWKVYGYKSNESDSMVDYFSPASWSGIATKNGYVLLVDVCNYNLSDSGREVREYNHSKQSHNSNARIQKLTAMMNDSASTENEKSSCAALIEKENKKANAEPSYTVIETFPTFSNANPKGASWHIEKDGQIIAKGNGVYATNTYDWENKEKSEAQQKEEKVMSLVKRIEKILSDSDALTAEVIKVPVKAIQEVEKPITKVTESDIKTGFTIVMKVGYTHGKNKGNKYALVYNDQQFKKYHTFAKLGKNNKSSKSVDKSWNLSTDRINELLSKGHIAIVEFVEVTEYVDKVVYKKTARKHTVSDVPTIETTLENDSNDKDNTKDKNVLESAVTMTLNEEKNGIEISFSQKPESTIIEDLKKNGFRFSRFNGGKWWAKQTPETIKYAESLTKKERVFTEESKAEVESSDINMSKEIYENQINKESYDLQENESIDSSKEDGEFQNFEDVFSKFDNIEITNDQKISSDDLEFCRYQEENYRTVISAYKNFNNDIQKVPQYSFHGVMSSYNYENSLIKIKESYVRNVCSYFQNKYKIKIENEKIAKNMDFENTYQYILENIFKQLDGYSFIEKAEKEIKDSMKEIFKYEDRISLKNSKLILNGYFVRYDSIDKKYRLNESIEEIFKALQFFDNRSLVENDELASKYCGYDNSKKSDNYERYSIQTLNKIKSIKFFKNGKLEVEFNTNQEARMFLIDLCGHKKVAI